MKKIVLCFICIFSLAYTKAQLPAFQWAKSIGSSGDEYARSITKDASGNVYTVGYFEGTVDFDPGPGTYTLSAGCTTCSVGYITKIDAAGNFMWAKNLAGIGFGVEVDSNYVYTVGNLYIGSDHAFISKFDLSGNPVWTKQFGGTMSYCNSIDIDATHNIFLTGSFSGTADFDPGVGTYTLSASTPFHAYILKLDAVGNFVWAKNISGPAQSDARSVTLDASNNVYITGSFRGTIDFDPGAGTYTLVSSPGVSYDIFILKLDAIGNFFWAKNMGGKSTDSGASVKTDGMGNVYCTGAFKDTVDFDPGPAVFMLSMPTLTNTNIGTFVVKLDVLGNFIWARQLGEGTNSNGTGLYVDVTGNVYTLGNFNTIGDFDPGAGTFTLDCNGGNGVFISKLDAAGNFVWAESIGNGTSVASGQSIDLDPSGNIYVCGNYDGLKDFDPSVGTFYLNSVGASDIFIQKLRGHNDVGIKENLWNKNISIYPNPANDHFIVNAPVKSSLILSDALGKIIFVKDILFAEEKINISQFAQGIYFIEIQQNSKAVYQAKLVKE